MLYVFDGTKNGFWTTLVRAFQDEEAYVSSKWVQLAVGQGQVCVETDLSLAKRVENKLLAYDKTSAKDLDTLLRCGDADNEQIAFRYFRLLAKEKVPVSRRLADLDVFRATECIRKVGFEVHRFHGFIRFMETSSGALYAPFSPDNDICELLLPHFRARLPQFPFVLHDVGRKKAAVYDGHSSFVAPLQEAEVLLSADEEGWQSLWRRYYSSVNIPSRERLKQMRGYLPARYWKYLTEKRQ